MQHKNLTTLLLVSLLLFTLVIQADSQTSNTMVVRQSAVKAQPSFSAVTLRQVALGYQVKVLSRQGAWVQIEGVRDKQQGWLRSYQLRSNISARQVQFAQQNSSGGVLARLSRDTSSLFNAGKKQQSSNSSVVATIGIRGLSEKELRQAKPNSAELKVMQSYASNKAKASAFAIQGGLQGDR